jgi:hypothetical protein
MVDMPYMVCQEIVLGGTMAGDRNHRQPDLKQPHAVLARIMQMTIRA